ncbi:hypothetical protein M3795_24905 [Ralstonia pickettii]|uniref:hypothetical protein n=1 Tax=Ralstonia pickettii TaxID=329 RepID=UPI00203E76EA|nr:hypothetical protein [Ralstonia pickettii]MCM3583712.1 hypothetical protein [Ralstonia pickettii]
MNKNQFVVYPLLAALMLSGCVSPQLTQDSKDLISQAATDTASAAQALINQTARGKEERRKRAFVDRPYLAGKSVALSPTANLPLALQKGVKTKLVFPNKRVNLAVAAEQITLATKIPVVVSTDVYLPRSALLPRAQKLDDGTTAPLPAVAPAGQGRVAAGPLPALSSVTGGATGGGLVSAGYTGQDSPQEVEVADDLPLNQVLDLLATRLGVNWNYDQKKGVINVYRMVTKTWLLPIRPQNLSFSTENINNTAQSNNQNSLQSNQQQDKAAVKSEAQNLNEVKSILDDVQTVMTRSGSVSGNITQGTITLTDTKEAVERAESIVNFHRAQLSKMVALHVRLVQVTISNGGELGVDWQAVLTKALNRVPGFVLTASSPISLVSQNVGTIGAHITSGQLNGTQAAVQALAAIGNTASTDDIPLEVQNRHTSYYNNRIRFSYVASTTPATATAGGTGGTPGLTTAQDQVGLKMLVYASVTNSNSIAVSLAFDSSVLRNITPFTSGSGSTQQTVQNVDIAGQGNTTDAIIRNGATTVLTVFDSNTAQYDKRTLGHNVPMFAGGSINANRTRTATLVVVSASIKDTEAGQQGSSL